jgi:hypothetical protein
MLGRRIFCFIMAIPYLLYACSDPEFLKNFADPAGILLIEKPADTDTRLEWLVDVVRGSSKESDRVYFTPQSWAKDGFRITYVCPVSRGRHKAAVNETLGHIRRYGAMQLYEPDYKSFRKALADGGSCQELLEVGELVVHRNGQVNISVRLPNRRTNFWLEPALTVRGPEPSPQGQVLAEPVKTGGLISLPGQGMAMLPAAPDKCQICATGHSPGAPHNKESLPYQYLFEAEHHRPASWADAMAHCDLDVQLEWTNALRTGHNQLVPHQPAQEAKLAEYANKNDLSYYKPAE